ncbi:hypothetical protein N7526_010242 [Penicillium atrosanguineum]|nr:hypothetical protein N7526_010242 [Penicillium atrosanguineum]
MPLEAYLKDCKEESSPADRAAEAVYQLALENLDKTNDEIIIPYNVVDIITKPNVIKLQQRFSISRGKLVRAVKDSTISCVRLMVVPDNFLPINPDIHQKISLEVHAAVQEAGVKMPTTPVKVPRPPNSFILYRQSLHQSTTAENPGLRNTEISRVIAGKWKNESPQVRAHFKDMADEMKRQHEIDHPNYQYCPRRPSERRRRQPRIRADELKFLGANKEGAQRLTDAWTGSEPGWVHVDDQLLRLFDGYGMMSGPGTVGPQPRYDNFDFTNLVDDQLNRLELPDMALSPLSNNEFDAEFNMEELLNIQ